MTMHGVFRISEKKFGSKSRGKYGGLNPKKVVIQRSLINPWHITTGEAHSIANVNSFLSSLLSHPSLDAPVLDHTPPTATYHLLIYFSYQANSSQSKPTNSSSELESYLFHQDGNDSRPNLDTARVVQRCQTSSSCFIII